MFILTLIVFIVIFSALVLVHEWGHFTAARKTGMKVEEFGIGLPPRAKGLFKDKKGTLYTLNWIPFGGFVRLYGEDASDPKVLKDPASYASKSIPKKILVITAGVLMNFLLAWVLISVGFTVGMKPFLVTEADVLAAQEAGLIELQNTIYIHEIQEGSVLTGQGIEEGDLIMTVNGESNLATTDLSNYIQPEQPVVLEVLRGEERLDFIVEANSEGKLGISISDAPLLLNQKKVRYPVHIAAFEAVKEVGRLSYLTVDMLRGVVVSLVAKFTVPEGVAGPLGIYKMTGVYLQEGIVALMQFTALLSISLGVINIMPFPALDGGRFLFIIFEVVTGKRANAKTEAIVHGVGFVLLMLLILVITWKDVLSFF